SRDDRAWSACSYELPCGFPSDSLRLLGHRPPQATDPPKMSMAPSVRVTMARLVSLRLPVPKRVRRDLPCRLIVLTDSTSTSKIFSTAILISVLLASAATRKVYLPSSISP